MCVCGRADRKTESPKNFTDSFQAKIPTDVRVLNKIPRWRRCEPFLTNK